MTGTNKPFSIALDISPTLDGNQFRGMGFFVRQLIDTLPKILSTHPDYKNFKLHFLSREEILANPSSFDLIHFTYFDPFFKTLPSNLPTPFVVTIPDLIPLQFPAHYPKGIKGFLNWHYQKSQARHASYIITISHASKYAIADIISYPEDRIFVTYLSGREFLRPITTKSTLDHIRQKYNLPQKFILYVGDVNWNKNLSLLLKACIDQNLHLVLVGRQAKDLTQLDLKTPPTLKNNLRRLLGLTHPELSHLTSLKSLITNPLVTTTGFVPDKDLSAIFSLATAYCQPSYAEGFGLPVIEAMQCGTPVVYALSPGLEEVVDHQGVYFNPSSLDELKSALSQITSSPALRKELSHEGRRRAATFSWEQTALGTLSVYDLCRQEHEK